MNVSSTVINKLLRDQMRYGEEYDYKKLYSIYLQIMNQDRFVGYPRLSKEGFERLVRTWVSVDGSWMGRKKGKDNKALFFKRDLRCQCPFLKLMEWVKKWKR